MLGEYFAGHWDNPPAPFNPDFDPTAKERSEEATRLVDVEEQQTGRAWTLDERRRRRDKILAKISS